MNHKKNSLVFWIALLAIAFSALSVSAQSDMTRCDAEGGCARIEPGDTIKIGVAGPITGEYAMYGQDIAESQAIAIENLEPIEGFGWELLPEDTLGSAETAVAVANKWITDPTFVADAGNVFTAESAAVIPIFEKAFIPMMSPSATGANLTVDNDVFNRLVFQDSAQGVFAAEFILNTLKFSKIAIIHDGGDYGKGIADTVVSTLRDAGIEPVAYESITAGEADYGAVLAAVASTKPEIIYYGGFTAELSVLLNQKAQFGLAGTPIFSDDGAFGVEVLEKAGANAEGLIGTSTVPGESEAKLAFDAEYEEKYGRVPGSMSSFAWFSYDTIQVLADRIRSVAFVGEDGNLYVPRAELVKAVRTTSGFQGITGEITCSEVGECNASGPTFYRVVDGEWEIISE